MHQVMPRTTMMIILWACLAVVGVSANLVGPDAASGAVIQGRVTDNAGKPIRGAIVKATLGGKTVSRYTQRDGRYEIPVSPGSYSVAVTAYGFGPKSLSKDTTRANETNFSLTPNIDVTRLSSADIETLLPDNKETKLIRQECDSCHNLSYVVKGRGKTVADWRGYLPFMTGPDRGASAEEPMWSPGVFAAITVALEKYFGPNAPDFGPDAEAPSAARIKHAAFSDAALSATYREWAIPGGAHSIAVSPDGSTAWFSQGSRKAIGRFNIETETFQEYPVPAPGCCPHTPVVTPDGRVWMSLNDHRSHAKLVSVDPKTETVKEYEWPEQKFPAHTPSLARDGNLWVSGHAPGELWKFDIKSEQFRVYKYPVPAKYPLGSTGELEHMFGPPAARDRYTRLPTEPVDEYTYHIAEDSHGTVWFTSVFLGTVTSFNPATRESKVYKPDGAPSTRGIAVDAQDNVWFNNFHGHRLGKISGGTMKQYEFPTKNATGYGIVIDKATGYLWIPDMNGNNLIRFDPKTERFTEYPMPTHMAIPRFIDLDNKGRVWFTEQFGHKIGVLDPGDGPQQAASR